MIQDNSRLSSPPQSSQYLYAYLSRLGAFQQNRSSEPRSFKRFRKKRASYHQGLFPNLPQSPLPSLFINQVQPMNKMLQSPSSMAERNIACRNGQPKEVHASTRHHHPANTCIVHVSGNLDNTSRLDANTPYPSDERLYPEYPLDRGDNLLHCTGDRR